MSQNDTFLAGEGDQWFNRNAHVLQPERDEYVQLLKGQGISPAQVLEVGCANGYHLEALRRAFGCQASGIDPSLAAISEGLQQYPALQLSQGTARDLPAADGAFDLVILGFCLYLCDREDLFRIAAEVDRVLADGGFVLIKDFCPPLPTATTTAIKKGCSLSRWTTAVCSAGTRHMSWFICSDRPTQTRAAATTPTSRSHCSYCARIWGLLLWTNPIATSELRF